MPDYRVITVDELGGDPQDEDRPAQTYTDLGVHSGHDADAAIEAALEKNGLPKGVERCVANPTTNWNEREVEEEARPRFKVKPVAAEAKP